MSPVGPLTIAQLMTAAAFLTVALDHLLIWIRGARLREHLLFASLAAAASADGIAMSRVYRATSAAQIVTPYKWNIVAGLAFLVALTWFVETYSRSSPSRRRFALGLTLLAFIGLVANAFSAGGLIFTEITGLRESQFWGQRIAFPVGRSNPWRLASDLAQLGLLGFVISGARGLWRQGARRRAWFLGGGLAPFLVVFGICGVLMNRGILQPPYLDGYAFLVVTLFLSQELTADVVKKAALTREIVANEQRWRSLLENVHLVVVGLDGAGRVDYVNPHFLTLTGYSSGEVLGQPFFERFLPDEDQGRGRREFQELLEKQGFPHYESRLLVRTGQELLIRWSVVALRDPVGNAVGALGIGEDLTARQRAQDELEQHRQELAHVSRVSTMGELSASLAHELNQPLTAILSNAQAALRLLATDPPDVGEVREILKDIVEDDNRAGQVIRQMRALVRKEPPAFSPLDLAAVIGDVVLLLQGDASLRNCRVSLDFSAGLPRVRGDRVQVQQVAVNLLLNAFDAMKECPPAERQLVVRAGRDGASLVKVSVSDHGPGLQGEEPDRIFEPFYTTKADGLGMGLAISRSIVEAHGGRLWAETGKGRGATFCFTLPTSGLDGTKVQ